jgi:hypothetical protein
MNGVIQAAVHRGRVAQQSDPLMPKPMRRKTEQFFKTCGYRWHIASEGFGCKITTGSIRRKEKCAAPGAVCACGCISKYRHNVKPVKSD